VNNKHRIRSWYFTLFTSAVLLSAASISVLIGSAACDFRIEVPIPTPTPGPQPTPGPTPTPGPEPRQAPVFGGSAALVTGFVGPVDIAVLATDELPSEGGAIEFALLDVNVAGVVTADITRAVIIGQGLRTESEASISNLELNVSGNSITVGFLGSTATAECVDGTAVVGGDFEINDLVVNGTTLTVTTAENQRFSIRNDMDQEVGEIVVNEQVPNVTGSTGEFVVNALRIEIFGQAEIEVMHARAAIECPAERPDPPQVGDFVTGGGFFNTTAGFANFGLAGGLRFGELFGHFLLIDHGSGLRVKSTGVTGYEVVNATTRRVEGNCEINNVAGFTFVVVAADNGEPGVDDTISVDLSNGYSESGTLVGGNIQLHEEVEVAD
jgi:hypothetical protein